MPAVTLADLPEPPSHRTGWPWTTAGPPTGQPRDSAGWPLISIVTPTLNQGSFIEATIRSVLMQGYSQLEYIVVDGGSTDQTLSILEKYTPWLSYWSSGPDRGQSNAINKGLNRCTGEVFNWINSDDCLAPGALAEVGSRWARTQPHLLIGRGSVVDYSTGRLLHDWAPRPAIRPLDFISPGHNVMAQPATFLDRAATQRLGGLNEDLQYVLDWELYLRLVVSLRRELVTDSTPTLLACSYLHPAAKTVRQPRAFRRESLRVLRSMYPSLTAYERARVTLYIRSMETQLAVSEVAAVGRARRLRLVRVLLHRPDAALSRFFWGAVRQSFASGSSR